MADKYVQIPPADLVTYLDLKEVLHKAMKVAHPGLRYLLVAQALHGSPPIQVATGQALLATLS